MQSDPRVLLAAGSRDLERRLTRELAAAGLVVGGRCLDGPSLLERASEPGFDVVLAAAELHRLSDGVLAALRERRLPVVLLAADAGDAARLAGLGRVLPAASPGVIVAAALRQAAAPGARPPGPMDAAGSAGGAGAPPAALPPAAERDAPTPRAGRPGGRVVAVTSGKGAPGKTTIAIALAALLGEQRPGRRAAGCGPPRRQRRRVPGSRPPARAGGTGGGRRAARPRAAGGAGLLGARGRGAPRARGGSGRRGAERRDLAALRERFETVVVDLGAPPPKRGCCGRPTSCCW